MSDWLIAAVADAIAIECGRCHGKGTERHQLDRDPAAGYGEHPCPNCKGSGHTVMHGTPGEVARRAVTVMSELSNDEKAERSTDVGPERSEA